MEIDNRDLDRNFNKHRANSNRSDCSSDGEDDHIMLFPITDIDIDASNESLADQCSTDNDHVRRDSDGEPVKALITLRERRLLKVGLRNLSLKAFLFS